MELRKNDQYELVSFTEERLKEFIKARKHAVNGSFQFDSMTYHTGYADYLIEYLNSQFDRNRHER